MTPELVDCETAKWSIENEAVLTIEETGKNYTIYGINEKECQPNQQNATTYCERLVKNDCFEDESCFITCNRWLLIGAPSAAVALCVILVALIIRERSKHRRNSRNSKGRSARDAMSVIPQCSDSVVAELANSFPEQHPHTTSKRKYSGPVDLDEIVEEEEEDDDLMFVPPVISNASSNDEDDEESRVTNSTPVISNRFSSRKKTQAAPMLLKEITVEASSANHEAPSYTIPKEARPPRQPAIATSSSVHLENSDSSTTKKKPGELPANQSSSGFAPEPTIPTVSRSIQNNRDPPSFCDSEPSRSVATEGFEPELDIEL